MNPEEQRIADEIYAAIQDASKNSPRSLQSQQFVMGISDLGFCPERNRRQLDQQVPEDTDYLAAFIGTAIGDHVEQALAKAWPEAIFQSEVHLDLNLQGRKIRLPGHPDVLIPGWGVMDGKTDYGLGTIEREGPSFAQLWQRNAYALAAWQAGDLGDMALEDVQVGNWWIDRAAIDKRAHVEIQPFDQDIIDRGVEEIDSIIYAYLNNEEAEKRPPRTMCAAICGHYRKCREWETDVHGLIEDPVLVGRIGAFVEGREMAKVGARMQAEAKEHLRDLSGSTGQWLLRWIWVNGTETRAGSYRIDVSPVMGADA